MSEESKAGSRSERVVYVLQMQDGTPPLWHDFTPGGSPRGEAELKGWRDHFRSIDRHHLYRVVRRTIREEVVE